MGTPEGKSVEIVAVDDLMPLKTMKFDSILEYRF